MNMVQITMKLPDQLAGQILPARRWLPVVLELSLARLKTPAAETSSEIMDFFLLNPSLENVLAYHASDRAQRRLQRLLALNEAGLLSETEQEELAEMERLEHILIMLKAQLADQVRLGN
ncbi:hypothetical protein [Candidatus Amarolinea dominans]|jgi:hypothetical protein|nr:hypothetical protein [Anaerolineae bacterium]